MHVLGRTYATPAPAHGRPARPTRGAGGRRPDERRHAATRRRGTRRREAPSVRTGRRDSACTADRRFLTTCVCAALASQPARPRTPRTRAAWSSRAIRRRPGPASSSKIAIDQRIGHQVPLDIPFVDETGRQVTLGDYFGKRPVVLALVYYECPMLCTQVLNGLVSALGVLNFEAGREFDVVAVSFNPKEGPGLASQKKAAYMERYGRPQTAGGWHFLTGIAGVDLAPDRGRGLPVRVRPEDRAVRPRRGNRSPDAEGHDREVLLRDRILAAGSPARADRGVGRAHRDGRRRRAALLLPLRPVDRQVRRDRPRGSSARGASPPCWRSPYS